MTDTRHEQPVIELEHVSFGFNPARPVLDDIQLAVREREFLGVVGPNGGGKSTLLKMMLGLYRPQQGRVRVLDLPPARARQRVGYVPQYSTFAREFPMDVLHAVLMGRLGMTRRVGGYTEADRDRAREAMAELEIDALTARHIDTLSGGELQRVLVARALVCEPRILLLDEPTSNIDQRMETDIFDYLREFNRRMTIVVVSHDIGFISRYVNRVACLNRTLVCHDTADLGGRTIQQLYGEDVRMVAHRH